MKSDFLDQRAHCFYLNRPEQARSECTGIRTPVLTAFALIAFAANSILCRLALGTNAIDAPAFTGLRLLSGALVLWLLMTVFRSRGGRTTHGSWLSAAMLFIYAITFSFAFIGLKTGTGALILFATVQATLFLAAVWRGERPGLPVYCGLAIALSGLAYLVFPGLEAPPPGAAFLMLMAGVSWAGYTLRGQRVADPLAATRDNFLRSLPFLLLMTPFWLTRLHLSIPGAVLAVFSGAVASALGYIVWYAALQDLRATQAALVQLLVPVAAAAGGVVLLSETLSARLLIAAFLILGGLALAICHPYWAKRPK